MLDDYLGQFIKKRGFKAYTEMRAQQNTSRQILLLNGDLFRNELAHTKGVNARVRKNGAIGFASSSHYTGLDSELENVLGRAEENASLLDSRLQLKRGDFPASKAKSREDGLEMIKPLSSRDLMDFAAELDAYILERYPKLTSRFVRTGMNEVEKLLYTSEGVRSHSYFTRSNVIFQLTMLGTDGNPVELHTVDGGLGTFTDLFTDPKLLFESVDRTVESLEKKAEGVYTQPGEHEVVLDPKITGLLAHEAIGHTTEADLVRGGSIAGPNFGKRVASEIVNLVDFANEAFGETCPVPVYIDDEGSLAVDAPLITDGILTSFMHNRDSAEELGFEPTGNARANEFVDEPLIRMRNTCILPGKDKLEDMIGSIKNGYYFCGPGSGQADMTSEFMFGVSEGFEIVDGKLGKAVKNTTISGVAFDVLKTVDMLGDTFKWLNSGMCGKKQSILVGMGGPAVKCRLNVGG